MEHDRVTPIERYWKQFLRSLPPEAEQPAGYYEAFSFGMDVEDAREIAALVLQGIKTATGALLWSFEADGKTPPHVGDFSIVTEGDQMPLCIIQTTQVHVLAFDEVDAEFAHDGGERDRTLASWREIYWNYILSECARIGREPSPKTPLVCERFIVVYRNSLQIS